jgi:hypothetical protein
MTDYRGLLDALSKGGVEFMVIGGVAAMFHGSSRSTFDVDVLYRRTPPNIERIANVLKVLNPSLRGAPAGLPFRFDAATIQRGLNFTLSTDLGDIDLLGEVTGGGTYDELYPHSGVHDVLGVSCRVLDLDELIKVKRAAGRPKDLEAIAELEAIRDRLRGT